MFVECVVNVSEGRDDDVLAQLAAAAGAALLDLHRDPDHHRSVLTLAGPADAVAEAARSLAAATVARLDLRAHAGAHPRLGVLDVVPFVPYEPGGLPPEDLTAAVAAARRVRPLARRPSWVCRASSTDLFPAARTRTLPDVRRHAFGAAEAGGLTPDHGPAAPDPRTGATAVGARRVLVAYNVWVSSVEVARRVAPLVRRPEVRALGLAVGARAQVSCNLVDPARYGPGRLYDAVAALVTRGRAAPSRGASSSGSSPRPSWPPCPASRWPSSASRRRRRWSPGSRPDSPRRGERR